MSGFSDDYITFINKAINISYYDIVVAGKNFGYDFSREHTPIAVCD